MVPNTRWPVSAAVSAVSKVSASRISPTSMTSGSSRTAEQRLLEVDDVDADLARWLIQRDFSSLNTYSIGSSMVMMWQRRQS